MKKSVSGKRSAHHALDVRGQSKRGERCRGAEIILARISGLTAGYCDGCLHLTPLRLDAAAPSTHSR